MSSSQHSANSVLKSSSLPDYPDVYFIGPYAERVSFSSQQRRALNLLWALEEVSSVCGRRIAVIGGGLAGLTAAAAAIVCGGDVWLFDQEHDICPAQRETDKRYIHPTINFWPDETLQPVTNWPFLNWNASSARMVIYEIEQQWRHYFSQAAQFEMPNRVSKITSAGKEVILHCGEDGRVEKSFDTVIVAVGFGEEKGLKHFPVESYWLDNEIQRRAVTRDKKIWISGTGDGALIDCLRVCYSGFNIGRILPRCAVQLGAHRTVVQRIERDARRISDLEDRSKFLAREYVELANRPIINNALSPALAKGKALPFVHHVHRAASPFDFRTAPIHRILYGVALKHGLILPIRGEMASDQHSATLTKPDGSTEQISAAKVIARHGAEGALNGLIKDEAIEVIKSDEFQSHQRALIKDLWPKGFFENLQAAQFPTPQRKREYFFGDAVRILRNALAEQGLITNVAVDKDFRLKVTLLQTTDTDLKCVPDTFCGVRVVEEVQDTVSQFHGSTSTYQPQMDEVVRPGSLVSIGRESRRSTVLPVTCLVTRPLQGKLLGLCVSHEKPTKGSVFLRTEGGSKNVGKVVEIRGFDSRLKRSRNPSLSCILFSIDKSVVFEPAPLGRTLTGVASEPLELFDEEKAAAVTKWGPNGLAGSGRVSSVRGIFRLGQQLFHDVIVVESTTEAPFSTPGDSGSLVVNAESLAVGVVFGGTSKFTLLLPLMELLRGCDVRLLSSAECGSAPEPNVLVKLGWQRLSQGEFSESESLFERAIELLESVPTPALLEKADAFQGLGVTLSRLRRLEEAESKLLAALSIREKELGPNHTDTTATFRQLGWVNGARGGLVESKSLFLHALQLSETPDEPNDLDAAAALHGLGWVLRRQGEFQGAQAKLGRALEIREQCSPGKPDIAGILIELGWLALDQGDIEAAKQHFDQALQIRELALSPDHPDTADALQGLGVTFGRLGRPAEAEQLFRRALNIREIKFGRNHPAIANTLQGLGWVCLEQNKTKQAEEFLRRSLLIREETLGPNHSETASSLRWLGSIMRREGRISEAERLIRRALEIDQRQLGPDHPYVGQSLLELGWLDFDQGAFDSAQANFEASLRIREAVWGIDHLETAAAVQGLGAVMSRLNKFVEAEPLFRRALRTREGILGPTHPSLATTLQALAWNLSQQGRLEESEPLFRRALAIRERVNGPDHPETAVALRGLGSTLRRQQKFGEADSYLQRAASIMSERR